MGNTAIEISNLSKDYIYYRTNHQKIFREMFNRDTGERKSVLKNLSLNINKGEKVAIIGGLGSGRTTLMRIISGILQPSSGTVEINGTITGILNHRLAFDATLTGRENLYLRAGIMGWPKEKIDKHISSIAEFAELTDVLDQPMKTYAPGSPTRLGFSFETEEKPDILLFDEAFTFGGPQYFEKCILRLESLVNNEETTMLMVYSNHIAAKRLCSRAVVLNDGSIEYDGAFGAALNYYRRNCKNNYEKVSTDTDAAAIVSDEAEEEQYNDDSDGGMGDF